MIDTTNPATLLDEAEHRRESYARCERLDCLALVVGYITSRKDGCRICVDCFRAEGGFDEGRR